MDGRRRCASAAAGHARIESLGALEPTTRLILRPRGFPHPDIRVPVTVRTSSHQPDDQATGFLVEVDLSTVDSGAPLGAGVWDLHLDVRAKGVSRTVRLRQAGTDANGRRTAPPRREVGATTARPFFTPYGNFSLDVRRTEDEPVCHVTGIVWDTSAPGTLVVSGRLTDDATGRPGPTALRAEGDSGSVREVPLRYAPDGGGTGFTARLPVRRLSPGRWTLTLRTDEPNSRIPVPSLKGLTGTRWFRPARLGRPYYAKPLPRGSKGAVVLRVAPVGLTAALRRRLGRHGSGSRP
ncbi:hypothetical protein SPURM210S_07526 [Streptomyces purpurascens]